MPTGLSARRIHAPDGGLRKIATLDVREVSFAFNQQQDSYLIELGQGAPKEMRQTYGYDDFGNVIEIIQIKLINEAHYIWLLI